MIAMALAAEPRILIADEPTTALDVTTQAQILELLRRLQQEHGLAVMLITHDMGVIAEMADEVAVMYLGRVVEKGAGGRDLPRAAASLYTRAAALDPERAGRAARAAGDDRAARSRIPTRGRPAARSIRAARLHRRDAATRGVPPERRDSARARR